MSGKVNKSNKKIILTVLLILIFISIYMYSCEYNDLGLFTTLDGEEETGNGKNVANELDIGSKEFFLELKEKQKNKNPLNDINVRKAIFYAIDRKRIVNELLGEYGEVLNSLFTKDSYYYNSSWSEYNYDLNKAKEFLSKAGYVDNPLYIIIGSDDRISRKTIDKMIKEDLDKWYKEINDECYLVIGKGNLPDEWYDKIKKDTGQVYFIATKYTVQEGGQSKEKTKEYGIFLVNKGVTYDVYQWIELENNNEGVYVSSVKIASISSIIPYTILKEEEVENRDVITYEEVNYNQGVEDKKTQTFNSARSKTWQDLDFSPRSLAIKATNKTIVVLSTGEETQGIVKNGYVFTKDDPNLLKYYWITNISPTKCKIAEIIRGGCPAAKKIAITYGQIY